MKVGGWLLPPFIGLLFSGWFCERGKLLYLQQETAGAEKTSLSTDISPPLCRVQSSLRSSVNKCEKPFFRACAEIATFGYWTDSLDRFEKLKLHVMFKITAKD